MNKKQINKSRMFYAVNKVLEDYADKITPMEALVTAQTEFKSKFAVIDNLRQIQEANETGLTRRKAELRQELMNLLRRTITALRAHAVTANDHELLAKCSYNNSVLLMKSDLVFTDIVTLIHGLAVPLIDQLGRFFLNQEHLDQMQGLLPEFKAAIPQRRVASNIHKVSTVNIDQTIRELNKMLRERIDVFVAPYAYLEPAFYNAYQNARIIIDYRGGGQKGGPVDDEAA